MEPIWLCDSNTPQSYSLIPYPFVFEVPLRHSCKICLKESLKDPCVSNFSCLALIAFWIYLDYPYRSFLCRLFFWLQGLVEYLTCLGTTLSDLYCSFWKKNGIIKLKYWKNRRKWRKNCYLKKKRNKLVNDTAVDCSKKIVRRIDFTYWKCKFKYYFNCWRGTKICRRWLYY